MTGFNTQIVDGVYCLQFETDIRKNYEFVQNAARACVDGKVVDSEVEIATFPRWISVKERLPEAKLAVLGYGIRSKRYGEADPFPSAHIVYTRGEDEGWFTYWDGKYVDVTHWMPLPEDPEEE